MTQARNTFADIAACFAWVLVTVLDSLAREKEPSLPVLPWPCQTSVTPLYSVTGITARAKCRKVGAPSQWYAAPRGLGLFRPAATCLARPRMRPVARQPNRRENVSSGHLSEPAHSQEKRSTSQVCKACAEPVARVYSWAHSASGREYISPTPRG